MNLVCPAWWRCVVASVVITGCGSEGVHSPPPPALELSVGVTAMDRCPGAPNLPVAENGAIAYCYHVLNASDGELTQIEIEHGARREMIARLAPWRSTVVKVQAIAKVTTKERVVARARTAAGAVLNAEATVELKVVEPYVASRPPAAPPSPPLAVQPSATGQPHSVEGIKQDGTPRMCGTSRCACTGDRIVLRPKAGEQFPKQVTSFPGITFGVNAGCFPIESTSVTWALDKIEIAKVPSSGGLFWISTRTRRIGAGIFGGPRVPLPATLTLPVRSPLIIRPVPRSGSLPACAGICVPDGSGQCLNELAVHDTAVITAFYAANGFPAHSTAVGVAPKTQSVTAGSNVQLAWKLSATSAATRISLLRDGQPITPDPAPTATTATVVGVQAPTTFKIRVENACGVIEREMRIVQENALVAEPDPIALQPGEHRGVAVHLLVRQSNPVDVKVTVHAEAVPPGSDNYPVIYAGSSTVQAPADPAANVPLGLVMEDTNTGIDEGTVVAQIELTPTSGPSMPSTWIPVTYKRPRPTGFAEFHAHPFTEVAFGADGPFGGAIIGSASAPIDRLDNCLLQHGLVGLNDPYGLLFGEFSGHVNDGYPSFTGWPSWVSGTHQQMHDDWVHRAQQGGLRLLVALAVDDAMSCAIHRSGIRTEELLFAGIPMVLDLVSMIDPVTLAVKALTLNIFDPRTHHLLNLVRRFVDALVSCTKTQMDSINLQIKMANAFAARNSTWAEIAKDGEDAARIIGTGKLAVVIGIEMTALFGCGVGACDKKGVQSAVAAYQAMGVRYIFPLHRGDNAFGGAATLPMVMVNSESCADFEPGKCNVRGLTDLGKDLIDALVHNGMLIDIDHMGYRTKQDTFQYLRTKHPGYPVFSGHTAFNDLSLGAAKHDGLLTEADMNFIRESGGMIAPIMDPAATEDSFAYPKDPASIGEDQAPSCQHSTRTYKLELDRAVSAMRGRAVGIGTDFNGFGGLPAPRYGDFRCHSGKGIDYGPPKHTVDPPPWIKEDYYPIELPFDEPATVSRVALPRSQINTRTYDIRYDGVAHYGMLPDMMKEVWLDGDRDEHSKIHNVMRSADAFARAWRKADCMARQKANQPPPLGPCPR